MKKEKDLEYKSIPMEIFMKDNLEMTKEKVKEDINLQMEMCIKLNKFRYIGEFVNDKIEGKGKKKFANGDSYEGEWSN